ncbi:MAG: hypothetical protein ACXAEI_17980 [Candidatus Hodarchaeales archaeon]|jgi:hypothetical protein
MVDPFVLVYARENGLPLVHSEGEPIVLNDKDGEKAANLASILTALDFFSPELRFTSARFRIGKKPHNIVFGRTEDPVPLGILVLDSREPRGDTFKIGRLISFSVMSFLEWFDFDMSPMGSYTTSAPSKSIKDFLAKLPTSFEKPIGLGRSFCETILSVAQLEDIEKLNQSQGFFCPLEPIISSLKSSISSEQYQLLQKIFAHEKPTAVAVNLLSAFQDVLFRGESSVRPEIIELRIARAQDIRYRIRFLYPKKKAKSATPAWMALTVESPSVEAAVRVACEYIPAYSGYILSPEDLKDKFSKLDLQRNLTEFQNVVQQTFGPLGHSGIRGVIRLFDLLKIGTKEGSMEAEIEAGLRRIKTDSKLQEQLLASLERRGGT